MSLPLKLEDVVARLNQVKEHQGEEAYRSAVKEFVITLLGMPNAEIFLAGFLSSAAEDGADWLDLEELRKESERRKAQPQMPNMAELIRQMVPSIRTQGQYDLYMQAFEALSITMDNYFSNRDATVSLETLNKCLAMAPRVADLVEKAEQIPEEERQKDVQGFVQPPVQFTEEEDQRRLLTELASVTTTQALNTWYLGERSRIDKVVSKKYRDELFDAIRAKKAALSD